MLQEAQIVGINTKDYKTLADITTQKTKSQASYVAKTGRNYFLNTEGHITPIHEMGHVMYDKRVDASKWSVESAGWHAEAKTDILQSKSEAFAEAWGAYHGGHKERLPARIIKFIEDMQ